MDSIDAVVLAHGASGTSATMRPWIDGLVARGIPADAIDIPRRRAEDAVRAYAAAAEISGQDGRAAGRLVIGGQSYGGRVASLLAAEAPVAGLVLLSYPLHRPGAPDWDVRSAHWPAIGCPVLLLSGESDPFARIDLLRKAIAARLPEGRLVTYPRLGHTLAPVREAALDEIDRFVRSLGGRRSTP